MPKKERLQHLLESQQFTPDLLSDLFMHADSARNLVEQRRKNKHIPGPLVGKRAANLFYSESLRTRQSFETAEYFLGIHYDTTVNAGQFSSEISTNKEPLAKGETLEDTIRITRDNQYDLVVIRYPHEHGAKRAALIAGDCMSVINAGDGNGQHPTQAGLDAYTISRKAGQLSDLKIAFVGDLARGRTVHSLGYLLGKYPGNHIELIAPDEMQMKPDLLEYFKIRGVSFRQHDDLRSILPDMDFVYMTRAQKERPLENGGNGGYDSRFILDLEMIQSMKKDAYVMHPLPRNEELPPEVDVDPRVIVMEQADNGKYFRMALLKNMLLAA